MILVTGGSGLVGSYFTRYLIQKGHSVRLLLRKSSRRELLEEVLPKIEIVEGDILDIHTLEDAVKGVEKVCHAAAFVGYDPKDKKRVFEINVTGTANLVNACLQGGVKKLLHVSSIAALGKQPKNGMITEDSEWQDDELNSVYGESKWLAELEVWRGIEEGLPAVIVNPSFILGAGFWSESSLRMISRIYEGNSFYAKGVNGYVDVRDLCAVMHMLLVSDISGERYLVSAENLAYKEIMNQMSVHLGKTPPTIAITPFIARLALVLEKLKSTISGKKPALTREIIKLMGQSYYYDHSKVISTTGLSFRPVSESIKESCQAFLQSKDRQLDYGVLPL